ncbi:hypothetical protein PENSPDRAFT_623642 [Peniophora sp. CONT]|nr:hypothetical protein PENSPDRAFT_623642 [Peniophora sp. CONT]
MPQVRVRKIDACSKSDIDNIAQVFAIAFEGDPVALAMLGGDMSLLYALERATVACVAKAGEVWVASYGDLDFVSAATWLPPGRVLLDTPEQERIFKDFTLTLPPGHQHWWMETFFPQYEAITEEVLGEGVKQSAWDLQTIGTLPEFRRRGLASALVQAVGEKAKANDELVVVETGLESNLKFYASQGWKIVNEEKPAHFDDMDGQSMPLWVITSMRNGRSS